MPTSLLERTSGPSMAEPLAAAAGLSGPIHVRLLEGDDALREARADWLALIAGSDDPDISFQSFGWCAAWISAFAGPGCRPLLLLAEQGGAPLALLPLMLRRRAGVVRAVSLTEPHGQIANAVCRTGAAGVAGLAACLDALERRADIDTIEIGPVAAGSALAAALGPSTLEADPAAALSALDCTQFTTADDYLAKLSKSRRRDYRRKIAKMEETAPVTNAFLLPGDAGFADALAQGLSWKRGWLKATHTISLPLSDARTDAFFEALAATGRERPVPEAQVLRHGERTIAVALNLVGDARSGQRACYLCAYDPDYHAASPGTLTHQIGIQRSIADGLSAYSLLGHPTAFKRIWTDRTVPLARRQRSLTWKGHLWLRGWTNGLRPLARRVAHAVSAGPSRGE